MNTADDFIRLVAPVAPSARRYDPNDGLLFADHAIELLLLGVAAAGPRGSDRFAVLLRRIACPAMQPTADVIDGHLRNLRERGLIEITVDRDGNAIIRRTAAGANHLREMLRMPGPPVSSLHHELAFVLKVCLLDLMDAEDRLPIVEDLVRDRKAALTVAADAAQRCRSPSQSTHRWLARQASRLREDIAWLEDLVPAPDRSPDGGVGSA
jgi:hypothetical protein